MAIDPALLIRAADVINSADALLICAGAGMGVDSGLPDFRGDQGFWKAYPPYAKLRLSFMDLASPEWFARDPQLAWGFYGHRLNLYRATEPHAGFQILLKCARACGARSFVFTSNVDGHFQRAGFPEERVVEVHGSIHWMQCTRECGVGVFPSDPFNVDIDESTFRARPPLPACPSCGALARPNILMFGDGEWDGSRSKAAAKPMNEWLRAAAWTKLAIIECGAGGGVPTVRMFSEQILHLRKGALIRINVREPEVPSGEIGIAAGALEALTGIEAALSP
jgi:NAD-dependent SIR2 family protein deacetylase